MLDVIITYISLAIASLPYVTKLCINAFYVHSINKRNIMTKVHYCKLHIWQSTINVQYI